MGNLIDLDLYRSSKDKPWKAHCAIDVGSVTCGYAYSFEDTDQVWINSNWTDHLSYFSYRAPSAILYDKNGTAVAFGADACDFYISMQKKDKDIYQFFYDGLLGTHATKDGNPDTDSGYVEAIPETDKDTPSQRLDPLVLKHRADLALLLSLHCKQAIERKYSMGKSLDETVWSFVVPFTWDIEEKRTFRDMMEKLFWSEFGAEIYKVQIVTSTEALWAAMKDKGLRELQTNEKAVMLVHSGGERTEISVHTAAQGHIPVTMRLLNLGGSDINKLFESHFSKYLQSEGKLYVKEFKAQYGAEWLVFLLRFEALKCAFCHDMVDLNMDVDYGFSEAFTRIMGRPLQDMFDEVSSSTHRNLLTLSGMGKLVLNHEFVEGMNLHLCSVLSSTMKEVILQLDNMKIGAIILTGAFSTSSFFIEHLYSEQETKQLDATKLYRFESSATLAMEGAVLRSKEEAKVKRNIALLYSSVSYESCDKSLAKVYPVLSKGQAIEVGRCFQFGPIHMNIYSDQSICFYICEVERELKILTGGRYHHLPSFTDKTKLGTLALDVPSEDSQEVHTVYMDVTMDVVEFKITMRLKMPLPHREVSVVFPY